METLPAIRPLRRVVGTNPPYILTQDLDVFALSDEREIDRMERFLADPEMPLLSQEDLAFLSQCYPPSQGTTSERAFLLPRNLWDDMLSGIYVDTLDDGSHEGMDRLVQLSEDGFWKAAFRSSAYHTIITLHVYPSSDISRLSQLLQRIHHDAEWAHLSPILVFRTADLTWVQRCRSLPLNDKTTFYKYEVSGDQVGHEEVHIENTQTGVLIRCADYDVETTRGLLRNLRRPGNPVEVGITIDVERARCDPERFARFILEMSIEEGVFMDDCWLARTLRHLKRKNRRTWKKCGGLINRLALSGQGVLAPCRALLRMGRHAPVPQGRPAWYEWFAGRHECELRQQITTRMTQCLATCALAHICGGCPVMPNVVVQAVVDEQVKRFYPQGNVPPCLDSSVRSSEPAGRGAVAGPASS